jgi:hypothetical protein
VSSARLPKTYFKNIFLLYSLSNLSDRQHLGILGAHWPSQDIHPFHIIIARCAHRLQYTWGCRRRPALPRESHCRRISNCKHPRHTTQTCRHLITSFSIPSAISRDNHSSDSSILNHISSHYCQPRRIASKPLSSSYFTILLRHRHLLLRRDL